LNLTKSVVTSTPSPSGNYVIVQFVSSLPAGCAAGASACTAWNYYGTNTNYATVDILTTLASANLLPIMVHEIGHTYEAADCDGCDTSSFVTVMDPNTTSSYSAPLCCDQMLLYDMTQAVYGTYSCGGGGSCEAGWCVGTTELNCDYGDPCSGGCCTFSNGGGGDGCNYGDGCSEDSDCTCSYNCDDGTCTELDPIILDLTGHGYQLTSAPNGVGFDFYGTGSPIQMSWTAAGWEGGFLALDRNGNGKIDNASELFSNLTPQPTSAGKRANGFLALAVYDLPANGGNGDGWIDAQDAIFSKLVIWIDKNHNGISEPDELLTMKQAGIQAISLKYSLSQWRDAFGNTFRFNAPSRTNTSPNQAVWDVLLQAGGKSSATTATTKP
jgi:hypothetical protein